MNTYRVIIYSEASGKIDGGHCEARRVMYDDRLISEIRERAMPHKCGCNNINHVTLAQGLAC